MERGAGNVFHDGYVSENLLCLGYMFCNRGFRIKSAYFESFAVDQVRVVIKWWWYELAASLGGVNCGVVISKEVECFRKKIGCGFGKWCIPVFKFCQT